MSNNTEYALSIKNISYTTEDNATEDNATENKTTEDNITEANVTEGNIRENSTIKNNSTGKNITEQNSTKSNKYEKVILDNVSFNIEKGKITALCGNNGAGKTTLLKIIKGLVKQKSGQIIIDNKDVSKNKSERLRQVGLVFQDPELQILCETVEKDIQFGLRNLGLNTQTQKRKVDEIIKELRLEDLRYRSPLTLSGGEKRRLLLAGVLVMEPKLIMLDEIFANMDYPNVREVLKLLLELKNQNITIVIVSHDIEKYLNITDNTIILKNGKVVYDGPSENSLKCLKENEICSPNFELKKMEII